MQTNRWLQALIVLLVIIASLFLASVAWSLFSRFSNVILLFFLSWLLAFILRPVARWLTARGLPYTISVIIVYAVLAVLFGVGGFLLVPVITEQISQLINNFDSYVTQTELIVGDVQRQLTTWGVRDVDLREFYTDLARQVQTIGMNVLQNTFSLLQSVATIMLQLILVLLLSFYFMKDGDRIFGGILQLLPPRWQDEARLLAISIERSFGAFVRGQLVFAFVYAILTGIVMIVFGLDYVVIASIVAGLSMIIPLVGNFIAFAPPMLVVLVTKTDDWLGVFFWLFIAQSFMMNFVGPRIMSQAIGIHPLYVVAAMLAGGQVAGFWGALFGIPIAGVINLVGRPLMRRLRHQSSLYREAEVDPRLTTRAFVTGPLAARLVEDDERRQGAQPPPDDTPGDEDRKPVEPTKVKVPVPDYEPDDDLPQPRELTLSGRAWHMAWVFVSRAYHWVGSRAQAKIPRSSPRQ